MRIRLTSDTAVQITADRASRRISGMLLPFDVEGHPNVGPPRLVVAADAALAIDEEMVLNLEHDPSRPIGRAIASTITPTGLVASFAVVETTNGTDALVEAAAGLRTGLSIEAIDVQGAEQDGVFRVTSARITEAALVRHAAFPAAMVTDVAATAATTQQEENTVEDTTAAVDTVVEPAEVQASTPQPPLLPLAPFRFSASRPAPTPGEYLLASLSRDPARITEMNRRIKAAAPHTFLVDVPGVIPSAIVAPVISLRDGSAPIYSALGPLTAPAGESFSLPVATPPLTAAAAATEKSDVTGQLKVAKVTVTMKFVKRAVNISAEAVAWGQPSIIDVAVDELADALAVGSDAVCAAALEAATGTNTAVTIALNGADAWAKLSAGVAAHYAACGAYPDRFLAAPDVWAKLAGFTNTVGAPLVNGIDQNLTGSFGTLFGVPVFMSPQLTAGKSFLVSSKGVKSWTNGTVQMRVDEPTIMGYALGAGRGVGLSVANGKFITPVGISATQATA